MGWGRQMQVSSLVSPFYSVSGIPAQGMMGSSTFRALPPQCSSMVGLNLVKLNLTPLHQFLGPSFLGGSQDLLFLPHLPLAVEFPCPASCYPSDRYWALVLSSDVSPASQLPRNGQPTPFHPESNVGQGWSSMDK